MAESSDVTACAREREPAPSDSLRTFGAVVQALREHAGLSRVDLGVRVPFSKHTVESVELGRRMPDESFVKRAEEALGNTGALRKAAGHLTRGEAGLVSWFRRWARLERVGQRRAGRAFRGEMGDQFGVRLAGIVHRGGITGDRLGQFGILPNGDLVHLARKVVDIDAVRTRLMDPGASGRPVFGDGVSVKCATYSVTVSG